MIMESDSSGDRTDRPTLQTIAGAAGVSTSLVSLALNGKSGVSAARRDEIRQLAEDLGYQPDPVARELRTGSVSMIGLLVRNVSNPFFNDLLAGMQQAAFEQGVTIVAMDSEYSEDRERRHIRHLAARRVDRLAIAPIGRAASLEEWQRLRPDARTVLINAGPQMYPDLPHVAPDAQQAVGLAFDHLWQLGHRSIGFLSAPISLMSDEDRYQHYLSLCDRRRIEPRPIFSDLQGEAIRNRIVTELQEPDPPTAVITNSDWSAHYVYLAVRDLGLRIGVDLSVVGHDDLDTSQLLEPALSTLAVDRRELGRQIFARLGAADDSAFAGPVWLIARASSGPPP
ncbi:LacI family DNA-binding transcriptional regulator [Microlunatus soli]|nr:LacI family DNA-binding transcriptional regulator [Microlunatus soli]